MCACSMGPVPVHVVQLARVKLGEAWKDGGTESEVITFLLFLCRGGGHRGL